MRRGGNWLSGFQHLSYSPRGESRSSTARCRVWKWIKKDTIYCRICWTAFYMCLICVLCVVIGIVRLIRASDRSLTLNWYPHLALNASCQCNAVSARDTHALILSRQKFQMSELQLCKHCVLTTEVMRAENGIWTVSGRQATPHHNCWQRLQTNFHNGVSQSLLCSWSNYLQEEGMNNLTI